MLELTPHLLCPLALQNSSLFWVDYQKREEEEGENDHKPLGRIKSLKCLPHHVESLFPSDWQDREKAFFLTQMLSFEKWVASFHFFGSIESPPQLATSSKQYYKRGWISSTGYILLEYKKGLIFSKKKI